MHEVTFNPMVIYLVTSAAMVALVVLGFFVQSQKWRRIEVAAVIVAWSVCALALTS